MQTCAATLKNWATTPNRYRLFFHSIRSSARVLVSPTSGNSSTIFGAFWVAITSQMARSSRPSPR